MVDLVLIGKEHPVTKRRELIVCERQLALSVWLSQPGFQVVEIDPTLRGDAIEAYTTFLLAKLR